MRLTRPVARAPRAASVVVRFDAGHPLLAVAATRCVAHGDLGAALLGPCAGCWERAIRDDERVVVEHNFPRGQVPDPV